jgi:hypothetical protein
MPGIPMIDKLLKAVDEAQRLAMQVAVKPISENVEYTAGLRIGVSQGIQQARAAILAAFKDTNDKDDNL